ncbi:MAG: hypothetical protein LBT97_07325 [Planctomycetota bacterium]|jgi:hypothetical protein|nr:hypothetical protein [Planctomycetota bacterium]
MFQRIGLAVMAWGVCGMALAGAPPRRLSPEETDQAINAVFAGAQGVVRMEADIITQKTGGMSRDPQVAHEFLRIEAPTRMWLQNRGQSEVPLPIEQCNLILVDGRNIWEVEARDQRSRERAVSRRSFRPNIGTGQVRGLAMFIGLFLMGKEVASAGQLRQDFDVTCVEEPLPNRQERTLHFTLAPMSGGETVELWMLPGHALPWKVRSFERKIIRFPPPKPGEEPRFRLEESVRVLRNVRTNTNGLAPFTVQSFLLPLARDMRIRDEQTNQVWSLDDARRELNEVANEYQARQVFM